MLKPRIVKGDSVNEFLTGEQCSISEIWNTSEDENLSIARARVEPGVTTTLHYLQGVNERYLITKGEGRIQVGGLPPSEVIAGDLVIIPAGTSQQITNIGETDLVFYCICTPRFSPNCYHDTRPV